METVRFTKLDPRAKVPCYATADAAGADLCAVCDESIVIGAGETVFVHTGLAIAVPQGYAGLVYARSGLASKRGLAPANKVGVIDADYRGEVMVALHNHSAIAQTIETGERIAQLVITPVLHVAFDECESLDETERGEGGFGSTGRK
ncbi:MAG: dUTP diphosphatase [Clostridia bacterium]|nr:dUTP diphosphatase [Clostridia bacterium]